MIRLPYRAFRNVKIAPQLAPPNAPSVRYRPIIPLRIIAPGPAARSVLIGDAFADPGCDLTSVEARLRHRDTKPQCEDAIAQPAAQTDDVTVVVINA